MEHQKMIEQSLLYIEKNLHETLSLENVANQFHLSKYYFHRIFSAIMGYSLNQYVLERRLNAALNFIRNGTDSLTDVAYDLNFGTPASFTRAFKRQYGVTPSKLRENKHTPAPTPIPPVVERTVKNLNGDLVTDFTLTDFAPVQLSGIAFSVDLATDDYKEKIHSHKEMLLAELHDSHAGPGFTIYSNCQPNSSRFNVLFGVPSSVEIKKDFFFTVTMPEIFCAKFTYRGNLLDIGDVLQSDYARFLKISKLEREESDIELIQFFPDIRDLEQHYHIFMPIQKLPLDME